jgi:hypothetical protein
MMQNFLPFIFVYFEEILQPDITHAWNKLEAGDHRVGDMQLRRRELPEASLWYFSEPTARQCIMRPFGQTACVAAGDGRQPVFRIVTDEMA